MILLLVAPFATVALGSLVPRQQLGQPVWGGVNISQAVLQIQSSISSPNCNATTACTELVTWAPRCLTLRGDPGCWCANPGPVRGCAGCMSNPTDNTTTPSQTQEATVGEDGYDTGCAAYSAFLNTLATSTSSSAAPSSTSSAGTQAPTAASASGDSSLSSGALAGIVCGAILGLVLIIAGSLLTYRYMQTKHEAALAAVAATPIPAPIPRPPRPQPPPAQPSWYADGDASKYAPTVSYTARGSDTGRRSMASTEALSSQMTGTTHAPPPWTPSNPTYSPRTSALPGGGSYSVEPATGGYWRP